MRPRMRKGSLEKAAREDNDKKWGNLLQKKEGRGLFGA